MSEQTRGYMAELDRWTERTILAPHDSAVTAVRNAPNELVESDCRADLAAVEEGIKKAIREKVLESYRNGQSAGPRPEYKQKTRK